MPITIDEAIKELEGNIRPEIDVPYPELASAMRLGIEALKRHELREHLTLRNILEPLPGETEK